MYARCVMNMSSKSLSLFLNSAIADGKTTKTQIARAAKISRSILDAYFEGTSAPTLDSLDRIAAALGMQAWEIIQPGGATPTVIEHDINECLRRVSETIKEQKERIRELEDAIAQNLTFDAEDDSELPAKHPKGRKQGA